MNTNDRTIIYIKAAECLYEGRHLNSEDIERLKLIKLEMEQTLDLMTFVFPDLSEKNNELSDYLPIHIHQINEALNTGVVPDVIGETREYCAELGRLYLEELNTHSTIN
jgi:hypothetical protein